MSLPMPIHEVQRIVFLHSFHVLDSAAEPAFYELAELAELASQICGTPIGLNLLVDSSRQWFKGSVGLDV